MSIRPMYLRSAANFWADNLSRELDRDDLQLNPQIFDYLQAEWGYHSMDRFASTENAQIPVSTPSGATPSARTSTVCTYRTPRGNARPTTATPHGPLYPLFVQSYTNWARQPRSSRPTGPTNHGFNSYTTWPPRPFTTPPHATYSSPDGTARAKGSDDQDGASRLFDCHAGLATHPQRRFRMDVTDLQP
jgi:hypothetical protein